MAASIGTWATFTNGSDPSGFSSSVIDAGSNRKFMYVVMGETDVGSLSITTTLGGQSPTETKSLDVELGSGAADIAIRAFVFDESTIGSMNANNVTWSDGVTWNKVSWSYVTITDTDQGTTDSDTDSTTSGTSVNVIWPSTTDTDGIVVALGVANSANRQPIGFDASLTSRQQYSLADYAAGIGDGPGGGGVATDMTITNDEFANSGLGGMGLWFPQATGSVAAIYNLLMQDN